MGGGIAAYKSCELLRRFQASGHDVTVIPTKSSLEFIGSSTWEALSGKPVTTEVFDSVYEVPHVRLGQEADLFVIAPATANLIAKLANGLADDLLTNSVLMAQCPILVVPAMHTEMWLNPATQANVQTLRGRGIRVVDPDVGRLTGPDSGPGRLPEPQAIEIAAQVLIDGYLPDLDLRGKRLLVTGGGTRESIDPVRDIGNRSSGKQAWAIASAASVYGAKTTVIAANVELPSPVGAAVINVKSALEMAEAVNKQLCEADVLVMCAAVADFRPKDPADVKIKKTSDDFVPMPIELERNPDILATIGALPEADRPLLVGFAAETVTNEEQLVEYGMGKLTKKSADFLIANPVGKDQTFGEDSNSGLVLGPAGILDRVEKTSKAGLANALFAACRDRLTS